MKVYVVVTKYMGGTQDEAVFSSMEKVNQYLESRGSEGSPEVLEDQVRGELEDPNTVFTASLYDRSLDIHNFQGIYGSSFDGSGYLKRFFDLSYQLNFADLEQYSKSLFRQPDIHEYYSTRKDGQNQFEILQKTITPLFKRLNYSLRDINQTVTRLRLILRSIPHEQSIDTPILVVLLVLREKNSSL